MKAGEIFLFKNKFINDEDHRKNINCFILYFKGEIYCPCEKIIKYIFEHSDGKSFLISKEEFELYLNQEFKIDPMGTYVYIRKIK